METKEFMYTEVVANNSLYQHQVDDNNNRRHAHISIERTWDTKYWPDNCFAWYLAISEVNTNYTQTYFKDSSNAPPHIESRRISAKELLENTIGRYRILFQIPGGNYFYLEP